MSENLIQMCGKTRLKILVSTVISTSEGLSTKEAGVVFVGKNKNDLKYFP